MNVIFFIVFTLCSMTVSCVEFLYPVALYTDPDCGQKLLVMHQKSCSELDLWSWDSVTHEATKMLSSSFCPAGVALLPDNKGFSFIDNGRIRIKEFIKRSPRSIDIPYGLSALGPITWYQNGLGYFHAVRNGYYALFSVTVEGDIECCVAHAKRDCMYPSWFKENLFYIERTDKNYRIVEHVAAADEGDPLQALCVDFSDRPIIFLTMIDSNQGFFLQHAPKITTSATKITFLYHHLFRDDSKQWHTNHLFSFSVPSTLLDSASDTRLYESVLPLLPRLHQTAIYYADLSDSDLGMSLCKYNLSTHIKESIVSPYNSVYPFSPIMFNSALFFGGRVPRVKTKGTASPFIYIDSDNTYCFSLPSLQLDSPSR